MKSRLLQPVPAIVYSCIFVLGEIIKLSGGPGGLFVVTGLGLSGGQLLFSCFFVRGRLRAQLITCSLYLLITLIIVVYQYNLRALMVSLSLFPASFLIELLIWWLRKKKE